MKFYEEEDMIKKKRGRPSVFTPEERKERKKKYDLEYQKKRYHNDEKFKTKLKQYQKSYHSKKEENEEEKEENKNI